MKKYRLKQRVQLVLPEKYKKVEYEELHEKMGHVGTEQLFNLHRNVFIGHTW